MEVWVYEVPQKTNRRAMSYKPLSEELEEAGEPLEEEKEEMEEKEKVLLNIHTGDTVYAKSNLGIQNDALSAEETDTEGDTHLLAAERVVIKGKKVEGDVLSAEAMFEHESWKYKYTRRALAVGSLILLVGLLVAAITLIALSPTCQGSSSSLKWWQTTIIYQCYPRSFQDSDGDGSGDLNGIKSRLDYFVATGIRAVWLNPIFSSPQKDNGYDISNYTDIDPLFGTMADFTSLLQEMHKRDIRMILDFVPNHTSNEHPWFVESSRSKDNAKRDWYIWADGKDGGPPNNWISVFGGSAWTYDNTTEQYYLHQFSEFQPDLNYRNPEVKQAMEDVLTFWLDLGVDGFRMDAVVFLLEDPKLENETRNPNFPPDKCTSNISSPDCYNSLVHNRTTNYPGVHEIIRSWRQLLDSYSKPGEEKFMVGEVYDPISELVTYYGDHSDEFNFPFNFLLLENSEWTGTQVSGIVAEWLDHIPQGAWSNWVLGNHDSPRIASKAGVYLARALNVLLLTLPGTPTTYYGEEIMMTDVYVPPPERHDPYQDRDKERTPMQWNTSENAGFTNGTPWLPLPDNYTIFNVEVESNDSYSPLTLYRKLSELRSNYSALQHAGYKHIANSTDILAYLREHEDKDSKLLVVINFSEEETTVNLNDTDLVNPTMLLSSTLNRNGSISLESIDLLGGEAVIIRGSGDDGHSCS